MTTKINADRYIALKHVLRHLLDGVTIWEDDNDEDLGWSISCDISFADSKTAVNTAYNLQKAAEIVNFLNEMHIAVVWEEDKFEGAAVDKKTWYNNFKTSIKGFLETEDYVSVYDLLTM